jgi:hypothetical protein
VSEENIYTDKNVSVTTARVIISGTTYALRNITSVKMTVTPPKQECAVALLVIGIVGVLAGFAAFTHDRSAGLFWLLMGVLMVAIGILWRLLLKPAYNVTNASSAGEIRALTSPNKEYIAKIVGAINEAFVRYR